MSEGKKLIINCSFCDARNVREELLNDYEQIVLNMGILAVSEAGKEVLAHLPLICNANLILQTEEMVHAITQDGCYTISGKSEFPEKSVLAVNGNLLIKEGTRKETLENLIAVSVNGCLTVPESLENTIANLSVNGDIQVYPDDCVVLDAVFAPDRFFAARAREGARYFVGKQVRLIREGLDVQALTAKGIHFVTPEALLYEDELEDSLGLFDETVQIKTIPSGLSYVGGDAELNPELLDRFGTRLYIDGSLTISMENGNLLENVEMLVVTDTIFLPAVWKKAFKRVPAEFGELEVVKGKRLRDRGCVTLDHALLNECLQGITVRDCGILRIDREVSPERILRLVDVCDCGTVVCSQEQRSAVEAVSRDIGSVRIDNGDEEKEKNEAGTLAGKNGKIRVMNVKQYVL